MWPDSKDPYFDTKEWKDWNYKANGFEARDQRIAAEAAAEEAKQLEIATRQRAMDASRASERPGYDPASGMNVSEYNAMYDRRFPYGDPGPFFPNPSMRGPISGESPIIANQRNIKTDPNATMIPLNPEMRSTYHNGGQSLPYVGNSWWQANEPIFPWNRKDWPEKRAGYAKTMNGWFK
jgi:hypothetical protein